MRHEDRSHRSKPPLRTAQRLLSFAKYVAIFTWGEKKNEKKGLKKKSIELWKKVLLSFPLHLKLYGHKNVCV